MMLMYALERRGAAFVAGFTLGCALSSAYGFMSGAWPFGVVEAIWCLIAFRRFQEHGRRTQPPSGPRTALD
jgi:dolichyl-phosphate-mannose--protein O-mannosyl transferase